MVDASRQRSLPPCCLITKSSRSFITTTFLELAIKGLSSTPQRAGIEPPGVAIKHGLEEVERRRMRLPKLVGIGEILPGLGDGASGIIIESLVLVAGDDPARVQGLDHVDCLA